MACPAAEAVWADIQLVWANCRTFNAAASPICRLCGEAEAATLHGWAAASLPVPMLGSNASAGVDEPAPQAKRRKKAVEGGAAGSSPAVSLLDHRRDHAG